MDQVHSLMAAQQNFLTPLKERTTNSIQDSQTVRGSHVRASATTMQPNVTRPKQTTLMMAFEKGTLYDGTYIGINIFILFIL